MVAFKVTSLSSSKTETPSSVYAPVQTYGFVPISSARMIGFTFPNSNLTVVPSLALEENIE